LWSLDWPHCSPHALGRLGLLPLTRRGVCGNTFRVATVSPRCVCSLWIIPHSMSSVCQAALSGVFQETDSVQLIVRKPEHVGEVRLRNFLPASDFRSREFARYTHFGSRYQGLFPMPIGSFSPPLADRDRPKRQTSPGESNSPGLSGCTHFRSLLLSGTNSWLPGVLSPNPPLDVAARFAVAKKMSRRRMSPSRKHRTMRRT
jgi:hypothetical protein